MDWIHSIFFGSDNGASVASDLRDSYGDDAGAMSVHQTDRTCFVEIESSRGWGHEQTEVMGEAYTSGRVSWWQRLTGQG